VVIQSTLIPLQHVENQAYNSLLSKNPENSQNQILTAGCISREIYQSSRRKKVVAEETAVMGTNIK